MNKQVLTGNIMNDDAPYYFPCLIWTVTLPRSGHDCDEAGSNNDDDTL